MLVYCATGFLIYLMIQFMEVIQNLHLNRIDEQLTTLDQQMNNEFDADPSPELSTSTAPTK